MRNHHAISVRNGKSYGGEHDQTDQLAHPENWPDKGTQPRRKIAGEIYHMEKKEKKNPLSQAITKEQKKGGRIENPGERCRGPPKKMPQPSEVQTNDYPSLRSDLPI